MRDKEKDAIQMAIKRQRMLEVGFRLFSEKSIDAVSMSEVARECGYGIATLYRYFNTKMALVIAVGAWSWERYLQQTLLWTGDEALEGLTAAEQLDMHLDFFIDLFRNHANLLRFNQFFNIYVRGMDMGDEQMTPYMHIIEEFAQKFHAIYAKGMQDGTLCSDIPEGEMFTGSLHIMLAAATRYAIGLVYTPESWSGAESELLLIKKMLLREYVAA